MQNSISLAWLILDEGTTSEIRFELTNTYTYIGRGADCDILIKDKLASRKHAVIHYYDSKFVIEDLDSKNGTLVNNTLITKEPISDGDQIQIGDTILHFRTEFDPDATIIQKIDHQETIATARKTIPQEYDFVYCSQCEQKNLSTNTVCSKCNTVLPQLPENFQQSVQSFRKAQTKFYDGQMTEDEFHVKLSELVVQDQNGNFWMMGVESGIWYRFEGENWIEDSPPLITQVERQIPDQVLPEKPPQKPSRFGRWGAVGLWMISAILVLAIGVYSVIELISFFQGPRNYQPAPDSQDLRGEDFYSSEPADPETSNEVVSPTSEAVFLPTETSEVIPTTDLVSPELVFRIYNPGIDSSLLSFTAEAEYQSDQSSSEHTIYKGNYPANSSAILAMGWCAIDQETLNNNMSEIQLSGVFDNQAIPQNSWTQENTQIDDMYCRIFRAVVEGLSPGTHQYLWTASYSNPVNDGWETYPPGNYVTEYIIEVADQ